VSERFAATVPSHVAVLRAADPFRAFVTFARSYMAAALRPPSWFGTSGIAASAIIHPTAHLEDDVVVDPLAIIGPGVEIGTGTVIGSGAVIGPNVRIGRELRRRRRYHDSICACRRQRPDSPGLSHRTGRFWIRFRLQAERQGAAGRRVLIQHDVEIGAERPSTGQACATTVIGEGTKIDNQVQIGHNVTVGRIVCLRQGGARWQSDDWRPCGAGRRGRDQQSREHRDGPRSRQ